MKRHREGHVTKRWNPGRFSSPPGMGLILVSICLLIFSAGCSDHTDYRLGIVTRLISGSLVVNGEPAAVEPIVIVRKYNRTLIETSGGYLYRVSAEVVYPIDGRYRVQMGAETNRVELTFLGRFHTPLTYQFKRTLGVSEYIYNARLKSDPAWRDSYFLLIKPALTEYIVEQRFNMRKSDQLFLAEWMDRAEAGL